jgi:hypothetical protein
MPTNFEVLSMSPSSPTRRRLLAGIELRAVLDTPTRVGSPQPRGNGQDTIEQHVSSQSVPASKSDDEGSFN